MDYDQFITEKTRRFTSHGFEPLSITAPLFGWQAHVIKWAVRNGRAALFEDCGLGKTAQQLETLKAQVDAAHQSVKIREAVAAALNSNPDSVMSDDEFTRPD